MGALLVVVHEPSVKIGLPLLQRAIDLLPKRHAIELVQQGLMEALANPVGLGMPRLRLGVIDILHRQVEFVFVAIGGAAALGASIGQHAIKRNFMLVEERQDSVIE